MVQLCLENGCYNKIFKIKQIMYSPKVSSFVVPPPPPTKNAGCARDVYIHLMAAFPLRRALCNA
jgi:hypothetical protein